jgi:hypothetical protein
MDKTDTQVTGESAPSTDTASTVEDTAATQTNEAGELSQGTPKAAQSSEKTEESTQTEVTATDTAQEEKLLAGKYKSVEDLEKSYKELESKYGKEASDRAELAKILNEAFAPPAADTATDTGYDADEESPALKKATAAELKSTILEFMYTHSDADPTTLNEILKNDPLIGRISGEDAKLEYAYLRAKSLGSEKALAEVQKKAKDATVAKIAEKEVAKVETASKADTTDDKAELMTQATSGTPDERKAARNALIRQHLTKL